MAFKYLPLIFLLYCANYVEIVAGSLAQNSDPDAIKCGDHFYYIGFSSPTLSRYYAATGSTTKNQSYQIINGVLQNKRGTQITSNCENEKIEELWNSRRAYRLQSEGVNSILKAQSYPDAIKCGNKILKINIYLSFISIYQYFTAINQSYVNQGLNMNPTTQNGIDCQSKSISQLKTDKQTYNFLAEKVTTPGQSIFSMTGNYPDAFDCHDGAIMYIHSISQDQSKIVYRSDYSTELNEIVYINGVQSSTGTYRGDCDTKSINRLIGQSRAFYLSSPVLICPEDITSINRVVIFSITATPILTITSTPASGSTFTPNKTTVVNVQATHSNGFSLTCTFGITISDKIAPTLNCPQNIKQLDPIAKFTATATDNSSQPIKITYDKAPGSAFIQGKTTVKVTATDVSGNQAFCTFEVDIIKQVDISKKVPVETKSKTQTSNKSSDNLYIGIIIGSAIVLIVASVSIVTLVHCKKQKKGCFKVKAVHSKSSKFQEEKKVQVSSNIPGSQNRLEI